MDATPVPDNLTGCLAAP